VACRCAANSFRGIEPRINPKGEVMKKEQIELVETEKLEEAICFEIVELDDDMLNAVTGGAPNTSCVNPGCTNTGC
jgi:hypothetical protein